MTETRMHFVKSAQRVLEVLEYFDDTRPTATVTDISRALSYPQSSTSVLLRCLRELGFLFYDRFHRTYRPTARAALLGCWAEGGIYRGGRVFELVDAIAARFGETVTLSSAHVDYAVHHLHVVRGANPDAIQLNKGACGSILHNVQGELLLATYPDPQLRLALHRLNADETDPERRVSINEKISQMRELRDRGWSSGMSGEGVGTIAVFMPRRKGGDRIALSVFAKAEVIEQRRDEILKGILEERDQVFGWTYENGRHMAGDVPLQSRQEHLV